MPPFPPPDPHQPPPVYGDRPSRASLFWLRRKNTMRRLVVFLGLMLVLIGGGWIALGMVSDRSMSSLRTKLEAMDPLQIKHIVIRGRQLTDESDILARLDMQKNRSLFGFSVEQARLRIDALPFVEHSTVERHLPDTVIITLTERVPVAIWQTRRHFILINRAGDRVSERDLTAQDSTAFHKLPLVVGQGANVAAASIIDLLAHYPDIKSRILALIRIGERRWNLLMRNGTIVLLPEGAENAALARLTDYQKQIRLLERPVTSIDLRLADRMVIHTPSSPPSSSPSPGTDAP
ncbi:MULTISPECIES: cell division protein FtsQ/DivIB [unclassified Saccharibacter]|uniref:cell division protein FtsQ/DivIB n=1 Tax=unclassified Saccharibacter TaxID=2648722 RepID=UPI001320C54B|nr:MULTISPECIES: cell division protein FtsQ/DivIB [unclassified Saccharibacter]MXV35498.1 FtsQ-type POTRA domain-containing protein [Saccharibacter sp. EH611]MXV58158.1 FtsQ-type POTRA domain-containing protein [Saccharibacter sp. EH70]MXV65432.1 FtsQ-type POTRA domain-containing protein [Saccharibacter sp. EH60]